jgi:hypothetical protein
MWNALALVVAISVSGAAQTATRGITYDCDTAAGHFSELILPAPASSFSVTGNIRVLGIAKDKEWAPLARVRIGEAPTSPGSTLSSYGGLMLTALPGKAVSMRADIVQMFSFDVAGRTDEEGIASTLQATGATQLFRLSFDGRSVTVAVGSESRSVPLTVSEPVVQVICSTGDFLITDLKVEPAS